MSSTHEQVVGIVAKSRLPLETEAIPKFLLLQNEFIMSLKKSRDAFESGAVLLSIGSVPNEPPKDQRLAHEKAAVEYLVDVLTNHRAESVYEKKETEGTSEVKFWKTPVADVYVEQENTGMITLYTLVGSSYVPQK